MLKCRRERIDGRIPNVWLYPPVFDGDYLHRCALRDTIQKVAESVDGETTILDVGCGWMPYRSLFKANRYHGVDVRPHGDLAIALVGTDGRIPFKDGAADVCVCWQVLEHVVDVDRFQREIGRCLREGGRLFLTTHGFFRIHAKEDYWRWTKRGLEELFQKAGWREVSVVSVDDAIVAAISFVNSIFEKLLHLDRFSMGYGDQGWFKKRVHAVFCTVSNILGLALFKFAKFTGAAIEMDCTTYLVTCRK